MEYRNELKYLVNNGDLMVLNYRLKELMKLDANIKEENTYNIRSVYFDDYNDSYLKETEAGVNERLKFRIRIYDKKSEIIKLEIKYKLNGYTKKESCSISKELCDKLIRGESLTIKDCNNKVLNRLYLEQKIALLKPKVIVEYDRTAYVYKLGNVRVTFDQNIRASKYLDRFFEENAFSIPILETNQQILEVKYDELLPNWIIEALEINKLSRTAFSKYAVSRNVLMEEVLWVLKML